jgi:hypothetical protein
MEAFWALGDLRFGPWKLTDDGESDWAFRPSSSRGPMFASDDEALEGYLDLLGGGYGFPAPIFRPRHWAYWRFEQSESAADAFVRMREVHARLMKPRES